MHGNKIEMYDLNKQRIKIYEDVSGHDLSRTLFNDVAEREGWNTTVNPLGNKGVVRGDDNSRNNECLRRKKQELIEESKIVEAFVNNDISKVVFIGRNEEKFSITYIDGRLVLDDAYLLD
ncbi:hypothetical protein ACE1B4_11220 [Aeromonas veronii]|uniref:hypothetical protein n=1 Tax=Aeromonas veronii TaxID=654 RepID=UPI00111701F9|nr:hypothetical protein [Aeromonas veronii]TNI03894.1 hypothetical protein CF135_17550 [Aeromonas veronii]HDO1310908.1 hypothetical protein [Aeromonas veronii]